jgi:RNA polymerase sigma-70 factor (ECF subfamily)
MGKAMTSHKGATEQFDRLRPQLTRLAHQILGSLKEAESVVHEVSRRWHCLKPVEIQAPAAYLHRLVVTLCLETLKSRPKQGVAPKLSNSINGSYDGGLGPDELTLSLMLALKQRSALERTTFLLHDVFGVPVEEVAATIHRDPAEVHELASRARRQVRRAHSHDQAGREDGDRIARAFFAASTAGDLGSLRSMLAFDVTMTMDVGGEPLSSPGLIVGLDRVVSLLGEFYRQSADHPSIFIRPIWFEGRPGYLSVERDDILQATMLEILDGRITAIYMTENTDEFANNVKMTWEDESSNTLH